MTRSDLHTRPRIVLGKGPRSSERALLDAIEHALEVQGHQVLERPIHLLVPSHSLRHHLLDRLVRDRNRSATGLTCWTLRSLARDILERAGVSPPSGAQIFPILVRRAAREEPPLRECLDHLQDGYRSLVGTVSDLLEAGLDPAHGDAIEESLAFEGRSVATAAEVRRAQSLVRVAIRTREALAELGLGTVSTMLQQATEILDLHPDPLLPCSGLHVYGFADATGVATDLILAALKRFGGTVYLDRPPNPINWHEDEPIDDFGRRFSERLLDFGKAEAVTNPPPEPPHISLVAALGAQAEVREIGWRIRHLLDRGTRPEAIAVVTRRPAAYRSALRSHFRRLGIPYSALAAPGPQLPSGRRIRALIELVALRQQARVDRWLDARDGDSQETRDFDLRLALFGLGVSRLEELTRLPLEAVLQRETYPLPVRVGFNSEDPDHADCRLDRRRLPTRDLQQARDDAAELSDLFDRWSPIDRWTDHLEHFARLLGSLGWEPNQQVYRDVWSALTRSTRGTPESFRIDLDEWILLLSRALEPVGLESLGGSGGGVQILDVIEARSRTFEHLFLLGMNKGVFPRTVREDPAFPDALRQVVGREGHGVLPDLPRKRTGHAEERFLFAQLCAASPHLTISWQAATDDNKEVTPSPLVERLLWSTAAQRVRHPQSIDPAAEPQPRPRTELENGIRAATWGSRRNLRANLAAAVPSDQAKLSRPLSSARLQIVDELNQPPGSESRLGPYFGFIGSATESADPRLAQDLYVTTLESLAVCPWRTFLERILGLETLPDPIDMLPGIEPFMIGQLVHRVLERLAARALEQRAPSLDDARQLQPGAVEWPEGMELRALVTQQAGIVAAENSLAWEGFPAVLARAVLPYVDQARRQIRGFAADHGPVAVEIDGAVEVRGQAGTRELRFRADRVDSIAGQLVITDYKTGQRGISESKTQKTRDKHLLAEVSRGRLLQASAYAKAAGDPDDLGQYLFIRPDFSGPEEARLVKVSASDPALSGAFDRAVQILLDSWHAGTFFPRLVAPDMDAEPRVCQYCKAAEACLRGDSGARGRLRDWAADHRARNAMETAFLDTWLLASAKGSTG